MAYAPELLTLLEQTLAPTSYCVGDMLDHGMGDWHAAVLLDNTNHLSSLELLALNARNFAGHTPLDIAYCLNRTCSGQLIPDTVLSFSSVFAGANPSLN